MPEDKNATVSSDVLKYVRCPVTRTSLQVADDDLVNSLNSKIEQGQLVNRVGETVKTKLDGGMSNTYIYVIWHVLPVIL